MARTKIDRTIPIKFQGNPARLSTVDWDRLRKAYIERPERPTIGDLSNEFGVSNDRIQRAIHDEGWPILRAKHLEQRMIDCGAVTAILDAVKTDQIVMDKFTSLALDIIAKLHDVVNSMNQEKGKNAASTRANTLNTCSFAANNLASAMQRVGVVGLPRSLKDGASTENGRWSPDLLKGINISIANVMQAQQQPAHPPTPVTPVAQSPVQATTPHLPTVVEEVHPEPMKALAAPAEETKTTITVEVSPAYAEPERVPASTPDPNPVDSDVI